MNDDCYIKIEVKYSPDAERDGFCSMWTYRPLDRHNAHWLFQYLSNHMSRMGGVEEGENMNDEISVKLDRIIGKWMAPSKWQRDVERLMAKNDALRERNEFLESTDLPVVVKENDELRTRLRNSEAQLGEANNKIAELRVNLMNYDGLQRELDGKKREMEWMKQSLRSFMDEDGLGVDG